MWNVYIIAFLVTLFAPLILSSPTPGKVMTPFGERDAAHVHLVPTGAAVHHVGGGVIQIIDEQGKILHSSEPTSNTTKPMSRQLMAGWIGGAIWTNNAESPTQSFTAKWTVPPLPPADGQNLFLFISLEPVTHTCLLQPVLQYGAYGPGGGNYWAVSNWWSYGWDYYYTTLIPVSPGRVLTGVIENTGQWFTGWNYQSYFTDIGDPMRVYGIPRLDYATETFRAQYFLTTNDFPPAWTTFSNINMKLIGGWPVGLMWSPVNTPQDGLYSVINIQGAQGAEVTVVY